MTRRAICERLRFHIRMLILFRTRKTRMTFAARNVRMLSIERKFGGGVIEVFYRRPRCRGMTARAFLFELSVVRISMAGAARRC